MPFNPAEWEEFKAQLDIKYTKKNVPLVLSSASSICLIVQRSRQETHASPLLFWVHSELRKWTDGTLGSPDSELNALSSYNDEGEEKEECNTFPINGDDTYGITPLTLSSAGWKKFLIWLIPTIRVRKLYR